MKYYIYFSDIVSKEFHISNQELGHFIGDKLNNKRAYKKVKHVGGIEEKKM